MVGRGEFMVVGMATARQSVVIAANPIAPTAMRDLIAMQRQAD